MTVSVGLKREKKNKRGKEREPKAYSKHQMLIAAKEKHLNFCHKGRRVLPGALHWPFDISAVGPAAYNHRVYLSSPAIASLLKM